MGSKDFPDSGRLSRFARIGRVVVVVASRLEGEAVGEGLGVGAPVARGRVAHGDRGLDLVVSGVGKANAACTTTELVRPAGGVSAILSVGIGGALPRPDRTFAEVGSVVVGHSSVFGDEGVDVGTRFIGLEELGFSRAGEDDQFAGDPGLIGALAGIGEGGVIATVSSCSGTDEGARRVARRTGAAVEAMEGAAVGLAAGRAGVAFCEIRVVSNRTGAREGQGWDLPRALESLRALAERL